MKKYFYLAVLAKDFKGVENFSDSTDCALARATKRKFPDAIRVSEVYTCVWVDGVKYDHRDFYHNDFTDWERVAQNLPDETVLFRLRLTKQV